MTTPTPNSVQVPVMIAPIGKIRILVPGRIKVVLDVIALAPSVEVVVPELSAAATAAAAAGVFSALLAAAVVVPPLVAAVVVVPPLSAAAVLVPALSDVAVVAPPLFAAAVVLPVVPVVAAFAENAPTKKAAWVEFKVVLKTGTFCALIAVKVTVGRTRAWSSAL